MENKNGRGIFLGVVSVATLIVAIIGATFAYFSASISANNDSDAITGQTLGNLSGSMDLLVKRVEFLNPGANSDNLVPADFNADATDFTPSSIASGDIGRALTAKCVNGGYTGCHVWRITATTSQTVSNANILLNLSVTTSESGAHWSYAVFTADSETMDSTETTKTTAFGTATLVTVPTTGDYSSGGKGAANTFNTPVTNLDIHNNAALNAPATAGDPSVTYYVMIYLNNENVAQNTTEGSGNYDATGTYQGTVTMKAAGGQVRASFAAQG